jgi:hypothetical protein
MVVTEISNSTPRKISDGSFPIITNLQKTRLFGGLFLLLLGARLFVRRLMSRDFSQRCVPALF